MEKRKTEDIFEIDGRKFILTKFDPLTGNYVLFKLLSYVLPFGLSSKLSSKIGFDLSKTATTNISKADFIDLQKELLGTVYEQLPGNRAPIVNDNGSYGVMDLTMGLVFNLLIASATFNFMGFFEEAGLKDLLDSLLDSNPANTRTSTQESISQ